jgi:hypothetical protein
MKNLPLNFCALVCSVDDILLIKSRVFFSITCREYDAIFCSIAAVQQDPADDTSQNRSLISVRKKMKNNDQLSFIHEKLQSIKIKKGRDAFRIKV